METGGMKGRRKEVTREALHSQLKKGFGVPKIYSEYGMTELFSQAYSIGEGIFECPPWMRVAARENQDPFNLLPWGQSGGLNIIDLPTVIAVPSLRPMTWPEYTLINALKYWAVWTLQKSGGAI